MARRSGWKATEVLLGANDVGKWEDSIVFGMRDNFVRSSCKLVLFPFFVAGSDCLLECESDLTQSSDRSVGCPRADCSAEFSQRYSVQDGCHDRSEVSCMVAASFSEPCQEAESL